LISRCRRRYCAFSRAMRSVNYLMTSRRWIAFQRRSSIATRRLAYYRRFDAHASALDARCLSACILLSDDTSVAFWMLKHFIAKDEPRPKIDFAALARLPTRDFDTPYDLLVSGHRAATLSKFTGHYFDVSRVTLPPSPATRAALYFLPPHQAEWLFRLDERKSESRARF